MEQLNNFSIQTLTSQIDGVTTLIPVNNGAALAATGTFSLLIDQEIVTVTSRAGNNLTVIRGAEGTTPVTHLIGAAVTPIMTARGLRQLFNDVPIVPTVPGSPNEFLQSDGLGGEIWGTISEDQVTPGFSILLALASGGAGPLELGGTWTPTFNVTYSLTPTASLITDSDGGSVSILGSPNPVNPPSTTYTKTAINATETISVTGTHLVTRTSNGIAMTWEPRVWSGVGNPGATGLNGTTGALTGATGTLAGSLRPSRAGSFSASPSSQKIYFASPTAFGSVTFRDQNGFAFSMGTPTVITVVNQFSVSLTYNLYESTNLLTSPFTVTES